MELTAGKMGSDCRGLAKPLGLEGRVQRVRLRIGVSVLLVNLILSKGTGVSIFILNKH